MPFPLELIFDRPNSECVPTARKRLKVAITDAGLEYGQWAEELALAVGEAVTNSFLHAGGGIIRVVANISGDTIRVRVADQGSGYDGPPPPFTFDSEHGRGRQLIEQSVDEVTTCRACGEWFCVLMTKKIGRD